jgi:hypothetical protein
MAFNSNDNGSRIKPVKQIEQNNSKVIKGVYDPDVHGYKKILCPMCCQLMYLRLFKNHMNENHKDYLNKHKISDELFEYLQYQAASERLGREKFIAYNWPEVNAKPEIIDLNFITEEHYRTLHFIFNRMYKAAPGKTQYFYPAALDIINSLRRFTQLTTIQIHEFMKKCVTEGVLTYDGSFYEMDNKVTIERIKSYSSSP